MRTQSVVEFYGSRAAIARALDISRAAVSKWGEVVPAGSAIQLETLTGGKLKVEARLYNKQNVGGSESRAADG